MNLVAAARRPGAALHRQPVGEWVCLDAVTHPQPHGIGLAESAIFDETGPIGRSTQTLLIAPRG